MNPKIHFKKTIKNKTYIMKIEIAESLCYSWLRHVKSCQIVQTNWKLSGNWEIKEETKNELMKLMKEVDVFFYEKYQYQIFKKNASLDQLLNQGECDALGIRLNENGQSECYAVDVAFHENGLQYGDKKDTVTKVVEKCVRTAFCLYGYLNTSNAEILFASPKIFPAVYEPLDKCIDDLNEFFSEKELGFNFCLVANDDFNEKLIMPTLKAGNNVADTTELFMRSYKLLSMFSDSEEKLNKKIGSTAGVEITTDSCKTIDRKSIWNDEYKEMKIGQIVRFELRKILESGRLTDQEILNLQDTNYSKREFDIQYPLLVKEGSGYERVRYYSVPIKIKGAYYYMCSQWFEVPANNDRPFLLKWIRNHKQKD